MNPFVTSKDPVWHRWIDGMVILVIGVALGMVAAQAFMSYETVTTTKTIRRTPMVTSPEGQAGEVQAPEQPVKFEEI